MCGNADIVTACDKPCVPGAHLYRFHRAELRNLKHVSDFMCMPLSAIAERDGHSGSRVKGAATATGWTDGNVGVGEKTDSMKGGQP